MTQPVYYSDINPFYKGTGFEELLFNKNAVNAHIFSILSTQPGQLWWFPTYACDIQRQLFEPLDAVTAKTIFLIVMNALQDWEPRIYIQEDSSITPDYEQNGYRVQINYQVRLEPYAWDGEFKGLLARS